MSGIYKELRINKESIRTVVKHWAGNSNEHFAKWKHLSERYEEIANIIHQRNAKEAMMKHCCPAIF